MQHIQIFESIAKGNVLQTLRMLGILAKGNALQDLQIVEGLAKKKALQSFLVRLSHSSHKTGERGLSSMASPVGTRKLSSSAVVVAGTD